MQFGTRASQVQGANAKVPTDMDAVLQAPGLHSIQESIPHKTSELAPPRKVIFQRTCACTDGKVRTPLAVW